MKVLPLLMLFCILSVSLTRFCSGRSKRSCATGKGAGLCMWNNTTCIRKSLAVDLTERQERISNLRRALLVELNGFYTKSDLRP